VADSIKDIVNDFLDNSGMGGYAAQAEPVVKQLMERERRLSARLIEYGAELGAHADDIRSFMEQIGMTVPVLMSGESVEDIPLTWNDPVLSKLNDIEEKLDELTMFTRTVQL